MNATCIDTAMKYMNTMKLKVSNFLIQKTRIEKYNKTSGSKAGKKGLFGPILNRIREAGGGNSSNLKCNGDNSSKGADQLRNLTVSLMKCEANINTSCNADLPTINVTDLNLCNTAMTAFAALTKECQLKSGSSACSCWTNSTLSFSSNAVKKCDISDDNKKMTKAKKACTTAFGQCRKLEDSVSSALSACAPANTKSRAIADIKQGIKNKNAASTAVTKINATGQATSRASASVTCAVFITMINDVQPDLLRAPLLEGLETKLTKVNDATVGTCTTAQKTTLITLATSTAGKAGAIDLAIESKQSDLLISSGTTVSITAVNATLFETTTVAAGATTIAGATAAAGPTTAAGATTTKSASKRQRKIFKASKMKNW
jgi:hypothetical protein